MHELDLWEFVFTKLSHKKSVVLLVVASIKNSSPGKPGFKLVVSSDGEINGTVGGGPMEYSLVEEAKNYLNKKQNICTSRTLHHKRSGLGEKSGLICGGTQTTIMISLDEKKLLVVKRIINSIQKQRTAKIIIDKKGLRISSNKTPARKIEFTLIAENNFNYVETIGNSNRLLIFGGGHIGLALSKIMKELDFHISAFDSRDNISTIKKNIFADKIVITPFEKIEKKISGGENDYAVVVTTQCHSDYIVLKSILNKKFKYIGLMGSRTKTKNIFHQLKLDGIPPEQLKTIHSPIGLNINAKTPEEIAISIAAELIAIKNSG